MLRTIIRLTKYQYYHYNDSIGLIQEYTLLRHDTLIRVTCTGPIYITSYNYSEDTTHKMYLFMSNTYGYLIIVLYITITI